MNISKSLFVDYCDFPKMAWWKFNDIDTYKRINGIDDDDTSEQLIELGQKVEDIVGEYLLLKDGNLRLDVFEDNTAKNPLNEEDEDIYIVTEDYRVKRERNLAQTLEAIQNKEALIYQPGFMVDGLFVRGDYLRLNENGNYDLIEVKAKTSVRNINKTKCNLQNQFLADISFQKYVINRVLSEAGLPELENFYYAHLNKKYRKSGDINISKLIVLDQVDTIKNIENSEGDPIQVDDTLLTSGIIEGKIETIKQELILSEESFNEIHPFTGSKYIGYTGKEREFGSIYGMGLSSPSAVKQLYHEGNHSITDLDDGQQDLFNTAGGGVGKARKYIDNYLRAIEHGDYIDSEGIKLELNDIRYPICFYDYESCNVPVPFLDNTGPYQHVVVQYSLHKVYEDGKIEHFGGVLAGTGEPSVRQIEIENNPNSVESESEKVVTGGYRDLLDEFVADIGEDLDKTFVVWYKGFENSRNNEISETFPELSDTFQMINTNTYDLMDIFKKGFFYSHRFQGSNSIKYVLPALVPSMSYEGMEIPGGLQAMQVLNDIINTERYNEEEKEEQIKNLLLYCGQDSLAMYRIYQEILRIID